MCNHTKQSNWPARIIIPQKWKSRLYASTKLSQFICRCILFWTGKHSGIKKWSFTLHEKVEETKCSSQRTASII